MNPQQFELVYKPTNLNVDNAIVGNVANSFFGLIKDELEKAGVKSPTYKIMPIDDHCGFMQKLSHNLPDFTLENQSEIDDYSYLMGIIAAVCYGLGIDDRHAENILLSNKIPLLIDLETSLSSVVKKVQNTGILCPTAGALVPDVRTMINNGKDPNSVAVNINRFVIMPNKAKFLEGLQQGLKLVAQHGEEFVNSLKERDMTLSTRYVPTQTSELYGELNSSDFLFGDYGSRDNANVELKKDISKEASKMLMINLQCLIDALDKRETEPSLLAETNLHGIRYNLLIAINPESKVFDYNQEDVPYFAVNAKTNVLTDSRGNILLWDKTKVMLKLEELGIEEEKREEIFNLLDTLESPLGLVEKRIKELKEDVAKCGDVVKCKAYQESVEKIGHAFIQAAAVEPEQLDDPSVKTTTKMVSTP